MENSLKNLLTIKAVASERADDLKQINDKIAKISKDDTDTLVGIIKNQPVLALEYVCGNLRNSSNPRELVNTICRTYEAIFKETGQYWIFRSDLFFRLFFKIQDGVVGIKLATKKEKIDGIKTVLKDYDLFDFLIRTKGFCYLTPKTYTKENTYFANSELYGQLLKEFFNSERFEEENRIDFEKIQNFEELIEKTERFRTSFELNSLEYSSLISSFLGIYLFKNKNAIIEFIDKNIMDRLFGELKVNKFIFDTVLGSELHYGKQIADDDLRKGYWKEMAERCNAKGLTYSLKYFARVCGIKEIREMFKENSSWEYEINGKYWFNEMRYALEYLEYEKKNNLKSYVFDDDEERIKHTISFKLSNGTNLVEALKNFSGTDESVRWLFTKREMEWAMTHRDFSAPVQGKVVGAYMNAFPYVVDEELLILDKKVRKEVVSNYLDMGGDIEKISKWSEIMEQYDR